MKSTLLINLYCIILLIILLPLRLVAQNETNGEENKYIQSLGLTTLQYDLNDKGNVIMIDLTGAGIEFIPPEILKLTHLETLWIGFNKLNKFPNELLSLSCLKLLDISFNDLNSIPDEISTLRNLEHLSLMSTNITYLPESIGNLQSLKVLNIAENNLNDVPDFITKLKNLETLFIKGNNISKKEIKELKRKISSKIK